MRPQDDLLKHVQDALEHLYDYPYLQNHPLAGNLDLGDSLTPRERMRLLRTAILEAVEELNPGQGVPFRSLQARAYNVLNLRYVAGMTVDAVARELAISERQAYRDLRRAERDLAALLQSRYAAATREPAREPSPDEMVRREAERLGSGREEVPLRPLVEGALGAVQRLGQQLDVRVEVGPIPDRVICTDRALARQALVNALSCTLQSAWPGTAVSLAIQGVGSRVRVTYRLPPGARAPQVSMVAAEQLVKHLGGQWSAHASGDGLQTVSFTLGGRSQAVVLVIDDDEGLHQLFRRYLEDEDYRLLAASSGREGLRLAEEALPDVIVLDVMMPQEDGWEVLQSLRNRETTRGIPIIVCSVLRDPQLAYSLGAVDFIAKPVQRAQLLLALARRRQGAPPLPPTAPAGSG